MKLQKFSGGLNIKDAPHLLTIEQGVQYDNIDNESGELKPCKALLAAGQTYTNKDWYTTYLDAIQTLAKVPLDAIEYKNKLYYSVEDDFIQMKDSDTEGDLGFDSPIITSISLVSDLPSSPLLSELTITQYICPIEFIGGHFADPAMYQSGTTYDFAFTKINDEGVESVPFEHSILIDGTPFTNILDYRPHTRHLRFIFPFRFKAFIKIAQVWRVLSTRDVVDSEIIVTPKIWEATDPNEPQNLEYFSNTQAFSGGPTQQFWQDWGDVVYDIQGPTILPATRAVSGWGEVVDFIELSTGTTFDGIYTYVATVGNFVLGWESEPSEFLVIDVTANDSISLVLDIFGGTDFIPGDLNPIADPRINRLYIYRIGGDITDFTLVDTIVDPVFPYSYSDRKSGSEIAGSRILNTEDNDKPLSGLKNLAIVNGQLIATLGSRLYFSRIGHLYAISPTNYRDFREDLTGVFDIDAGLLVCSAAKTWLINTSNLATGKILRISDEFGCATHRSMTGFKPGAMWSSRSGLCLSFGGKVELAAKNVLGFSNLNIIDAKMHDETYFGFSSDGKCTAFDIRYGTAVKKFNFELFDDIDNDTIIRQVYITNEDLKVLFGTIINTDSYTIFGTSTFETFIWRSPDFIEGAYTDIKTYKDIYVYATKGINFKTFIDDKLVDEVDFKITDNHHIKVDHEHHQGFKIHFEVIGKGTIKEIEYKAMGSQDGR